MKGAALILVCALALVNGRVNVVTQVSGGYNNPNEARATCAIEGFDDVLLAHENCNQFYKCTEGKAVVFTCQDGLLYDPEKERCEWPETVSCGNRIIPDGSGNGNGDGENNGNGNGDCDNNGDGDNNNNGCGCNDDPSEAPALCAAEGSDGVLVAHENCNQFYICSEGKPVALNCPGNLLYDPVNEWCDWSEEVNCGNRIIPDGSGNGNGDGDNNGSDNGNGNGDGDHNNNGCGCNDNPSEAPALCAAEGSNGVLVAHENCNQFYKCSEGKPVALVCPGNLLYDPVNEWCDWPEKVSCGNRIIPDGSENGNGDGDNNGGGNGDGDNNGGGNGDGDNNGGGNGDGDNNGGGNGGGGNCDPSEAPAICAADGSDGVLVAHENCNKFYICAEGKPVALRCPRDLLFDPETDRCEWPETVSCGDRIIPDGSGNGDGDGDNNGGGNGDGDNNGGGNGDGDNNGGGNGDGDSNGGGNGDGDNNGDGNGDGDNNGGGNVGGGNCDPSEAPAICAADGSDGVLVAHENCNKFYICAEGKPVALRCPRDLLFDPETDRCEWPETVSCGDRIIPDGSGNGDGDGDNNGGGNGDGDNNGGGNGDGDNNGGGNGDGDNNNNGCGCNDNPSEAPALCAAEGSNGVLVAHENCNQFYKCSEGKPVALVCPGNLLYDPVNEWCDWPEKVSCGNRIIPDGSENGNGDGDNNGGGNGDGDNNGGGNGDGDNNGGGNGDGDNNGGGNGGSGNCDPSEAPAICAADDSDGVLVAHENCNKFYICAEGKPVALKCPRDLLFDPETDRCEWPETVSCGDRIIPDGSGNGDGDGDNNGGGNGDGDNNGGGNGDGDNNGSGNGDGDNNNNGCGCNDNPSEAPALCAAEGSNGVLVAHENCNQFYKCSEGKPVALVCPGNLLYDPVNEWCDWPEKVSCGNRIIPDGSENGNGDGDNNGGGNGDGDNNGGGNGDGDNNGGGNGDGDNNGGGNGGSGNCDPSEAPAICAADDSDGVLVAHENCNKFYICAEGKPVALKCPRDLLFDPETDRCEWPETVSCGDRIIPDGSGNGDGDGDNNGGGNGDGDNNGGGNGDSDNNGGGNGDGDNNNNGCGCNDNPSEAPALCAAEGSNGVLVAHENCNQFYKCSEGKPVALVCPGNLLYDPVNEWCDWPEKVSCGNRIIPDGSENGNGDGDNNGGGNGDGDNNGGGNGDGDNNGGGNGDGDNNGGGNGGSGNCDPSEAPAICAADGSDGVLVAHENCNKFYICAEGKPVALKCPRDLLFDPETDRCEWPETVSCGNRIIPDGSENGNGDGDNNGGGNGDGDNNGGGNGDGDNNGGGNGDGDNNGGGNGDGDNNNNGCGCNDNPSEAPALCAAEGSNGVLVAHENCNQFYKCSEGKPVALVCPGNLLYDPVNEWCDWPEKVSCGNRIIPDGSENGNGDGDNNGGGNGDGDNNGGGNGDGDNNGGGNGDGDNNGGGNGGSGNCDPSEAPAICAADGSDGVLVAHENCNKFYICAEGKPVALKCPRDLLFDPETDRCEWPETVSCGNRIIPDGSENGNGDGDNNGGGNGDGDNNGGGNGDGDNNGGGNGDGDNNGGGNGDGDNNNNGCGCNDNPSEAPALCAAEGSNGVLVAHENCNQFYKCSEGKPVALVCPGNLLYDPVNEWCDWPEKVSCGNRIIPDGSENGNGDGDNNGGGNGDGDNNGGGNGDGDNNGGGNGDGDNNGGGNGGSGNCDPSEAPAICAADGSDGVLVAHENCNKFYICAEGKPVALRCPRDLLFDPETDRCEWPETVSCGDRIIPDGSGNGDGDGDNNGGGNGDGDNNGGGNGDGDNNNNGCGCNDNPSEAPALCTTEGSNGVLVAHENCNQFYKCSEGKPVALVCPGNLLYDPVNEWCDWPEKVSCGNRIIPDGSENGNGDGDNNGNNGNGNGDGDNNNNGCGCNDNPSEAPALCAAEGSDGVLVAHENCNQFYKCSEGKPVTLNCPNNLLYDPLKEWCDWPANVNCGNRIVPDGSGNGNGDENNGSDNGDNGEASVICATNGSEGALLAHEICSRFYTCSEGRAVIMRCPVNLLYNPSIQQCDWPENVDCGDRIRLRG